MNRKQKGFIAHYLWTFIILFCLVTVLFSIIYASVTGNDEEPSATATPSVAETEGPVSTDGNVNDPDDPPTTTEPAPTVLAETEDMGQEYLDKFIFMGDSTTYSLEYYEVVDKSRVWTPANRTFALFNQSIITIQYPETGEDLSVEQVLERKKPEYLLITLGINGVAMMEEDYFKREYIKLIERIQGASPDTKIILNSIYPLAEIYTDISMEQVNTGNVWVEQIAEQTGTRFLNSATALKGEDGFLPGNLTNGDGLHLNPEAFEIVMNYIRTHGYR